MSLRLYQQIPYPMQASAAAIAAPDDTAGDTRAWNLPPPEARRTTAILAAIVSDIRIIPR
jgi:hypothetical protein